MSSGKYQKILMGVLLLLCTGCEKESSCRCQAQLYERSRPIVALLPVIDHSSSNLSWNLSEELTAAIHYRLIQKNAFYLLDKEKTRSLQKNLKEPLNPFGADILWMKQAFLGQEFVVFMELMTHEEVPLSVKNAAASSNEGPSEIQIKMRLRVIDLRHEQAEIVLQEILTNSHAIPKPFTRFESRQVPWGSENYNISPLGMAHAELTKEIATHLEDYILLSVHGPS
jgi:hypothetical protein